MMQQRLVWGWFWSADIPTFLDFDLWNDHTLQNILQVFDYELMSATFQAQRVCVINTLRLPLSGAEHVALISCSMTL